MTGTDPALHQRSPWRRPSREAGQALIAGVLVTAGLPPFPYTGVLVPLGLALLFAAALAAASPGRTAWWFGVAHQATLLYWLFFLDPSKTIPTRALVPVQAVATMLYVSLFYLAWGWAVGRARRRLGRGRALLLAPALWTLMEALRSRGELGFPWCLSGACAIGTPLQGLVRAGGELSLGAALAFLAALLAAWRGGAARPLRARLLPALAAGTALLWAFLLVGSRLTPAPPPVTPAADRPPLLARALRVAAVQADVALADKWEKARLDSTRVPYAALTARAAAEGAELVVWAETAVPAYLRFDVALMNWVRGIARGDRVHLFTGFPDADRAPDGQLRHYNASGLFDPTGVLVDRYAKHHLLPIGETMPFQRWLPFLGRLDVGQAEWQAGPPPQPLWVDVGDGSFPFGAMICYESVFGGLARQAVRAGSRCLVVITNDGWFGRTAGPRQHAWLARLRALECGVPLVRSANNGISFICDADGGLHGWLEVGRRGYVLADVAPGAARTLYVRHGARPVAWFLGAWSVLAVCAPWWRREGDA